MKRCCPTCGKELSEPEYLEIKSDYESALDLLAGDFRRADGVDAITAIELARKKLKHYGISHGDG